MGYFHFPVDSSHLVNRFDFGGKTSMNAEDFVFNEGSEGQVIKSLIEIFPRG